MKPTVDHLRMLIRALLALGAVLMLGVLVLQVMANEPWLALLQSAGKLGLIALVFLAGRLKGDSEARVNQSNAE